MPTLRRTICSLFGNGEEEPYDLGTDPLELQNLADKVEWIEQESHMREQLIGRVPDWFLNTKASDWESRTWQSR